MKDSIPPLSFSLFIVYLIPGLIGFYAMGYISPTAKYFLDSITVKESVLGSGVIILVSSTGIGLVISAMRGFLDIFHESTGVEKHEIDFGRFADSSIREAYKNAVDNTFRLSQTYGNMAIGITILIACAYFFTDNSIFTWFFLFLVYTAVFLFYCHRVYLQHTYDIIGRIFNSEHQ